MKSSYYIINGITLYRIITFPLLIYFIIIDRQDIFKWLLACSFFTDAIDGVLARKFLVTSLFGAKIDSIGDDLTVLAGLIGMIVFKPEFLREEYILILVVIVLFLIQLTLALVKYRKITTFHTYSAKVAAILQGSFLILFFFLPEPLYPLFYAALFVTALDIIEEITLVILLPQPKANVKGLYWVVKKQKEKQKEKEEGEQKQKQKQKEEEEGE